MSHGSRQAGIHVDICRVVPGLFSWLSSLFLFISLLPHRRSFETYNSTPPQACPERSRREQGRRMTRVEPDKEETGVSPYADVEIFFDKAIKAGGQGVEFPSFPRRAWERRMGTPTPPASVSTLRLGFLRRRARLRPQGFPKPLGSAHRDRPQRQRDRLSHLALQGPRLRRDSGRRQCDDYDIFGGLGIRSVEQPSEPKPHGCQ